MTTSHTPEPWVCEGGYDIVKLDVRGTDIVVSDIAAVYVTHDPQGKVNAERIVVCVNACHGISTQSLIDNGVASFESAIGLVSQNVELLEALRRCTTEEGPEQADLDFARAVIAKVKP